MRRFFDFLFDTEEVEVKNDYVEEEEVVKEAVVLKAVKPQAPIAPKVEAEPVKPVIKDKPIHINLDEKKDIVETKVVKETKVDKKPQIKKVIEDSTYQFTPLISPIFGMKEEIKVIKIENSEKLSKRNEQASLIGTILSPIYGCDNSKKGVVEAVVEVEEKDKHDDVFSASLFDTYDNDLEEITFENIELEEVLDTYDEQINEKKLINVENLSLFDGDF